MSGDLQVSPEIIHRRDANWKLSAVSLPPEILSEIFLGCVNRGPVDPQYPRSSVVALRRIRASLASVCHHWRQVVQTTKALWALTDFLYYITNSTSDKGISSHTPLPQVYDSFHHELELCGSTPISLALKVEPLRLHRQSLPWQMRVLGRDFDTHLSTVFPRCQTIFIQAPNQAVLTILSSSLKHLTRVKAIYLRIWAHDTRGEDVIQLDLSHGNINSIHDLYIDFLGQYAPSPVPTAKLRLGEPSKLKNLTIVGCVDPSSAYEIVSRALSLRSLTWRGKVTLRSFVIPTRRIPMPYLRHLTIDQIGPVSFLSQLDAPNVLSLTLAASCLRIEKSPGPEPSQFPHLRFLSVESIPNVPPLLLIELVPELRALEVLNLAGIMSLRLSVACAQAPRLRLVSATWMPAQIQWEGAQALLQCWADRVEAQETRFPSRSFGFCFVQDSEPSEPEREMFPALFTRKYPDFKISLQRSSPFTSWNPQDWDDFFAQADINPSYLPSF